MQKEINITIEWEADNSTTPGINALVSAFARLLRPEVYELHDECDRALTTANALLQECTTNHDREQDLRRIEMLKTELARLEARLTQSS